MEAHTILNTGLYGSPIVVGGLFFEKQPIVMSLLIIMGIIFLGIKLNSDLKTAKSKRLFVGYGDLK